jgi:hypothetical protein
VDDSGDWGHGGMFDALARLSAGNFSSTPTVATDFQEEQLELGIINID